MVKKLSGIFLLIATFCISFSCKENKSLQELLKEETRAINRFIAMNDLEIIQEYPKNGVFKENQYFRTNDGLFFQVVDSGNGKKVKLLDEISVRYDYFQFVLDVAQGDTVKYLFPAYSNIDRYPAALGQPFYFMYGLTQTYTSTNSPMCKAWVIPLSYVGEEAVVNLIVPSSVGSSYDYRNITPVFYGNLRYTRFN